MIPEPTAEDRRRAVANTQTDIQVENFATSFDKIAWLESRLADEVAKAIALEREFLSAEREMEKMRELAKHVHLDEKGEWRFISADGQYFPIERAMRIIEALNNAKPEGEGGLEFLLSLPAQGKEGETK